MEDNFMAQKIAKNAEEKSFDINYESPFYKKARKQGIRFRKGGKQDDITVIIAQIREENGELTKVQSTYKLETNLPILI